MKSDLNNIFADIFSLQTEDNHNQESIPIERISEVVYGDGEFTAEEKDILRKSPKGRQLLYDTVDIKDAEEHLRKDQNKRWEENNIDCKIYLKAAAGGKLPKGFDNEYFDIGIYPIDEKNNQWTIRVALKEGVADTLITDGLQVVDSGGFEWVSGILDDNELIGDWNNGSETPFDRLKKYSLDIKPL